jgi:FKBP-type peptidyl-prolyl cis-trans isomerase SlyD
MQVQNDMMVSIDYRLHLGDNKVVDASEPGRPLSFVHGHGQIISGLEAALVGMALGEEKDVVVAPADGYGELDADLYEELPRSVFPPDVRVGMAFRMRTEDGHPAIIYVDEIDDETITVNLNHSMAGKTLYFHVKIADLREATDAELAGLCSHSCASCSRSCDSEEEYEDDDDCYCEDDDDCCCGTTKRRAALR